MTIHSNSADADHSPAAVPREIAAASGGVPGAAARDGREIVMDLERRLPSSFVPRQLRVVQESRDTRGAPSRDLTKRLASECQWSRSEP
jgi:hypothetical protein